MSFRLPVTNLCCRPVCLNCRHCRPDGRHLSLEEVTEKTKSHNDIVLGGSNVLQWPFLNDFLLQYSTDKNGFDKKITLEILLSKLNDENVNFLVEQNLHNLIIVHDIQKEDTHTSGGSQRDSSSKTKKFLEKIQRKYTAAEHLLLLRRENFSYVENFLQNHNKNNHTLELADVENLPEIFNDLEKLFLEHHQLFFSGLRSSKLGYLPPCFFKRLWQVRSQAFMKIIGSQVSFKNNLYPTCSDCALQNYCNFQDSSPSLHGMNKTPIAQFNLPWRQKRKTQRPSPANESKAILCTKPFTTMQVSDLDGKVHQCCSTWTKGSRGDVFQNSLSEIWNNQHYQAARHQMIRDQHKMLCHNICPRLYDKKHSFDKFEIIDGEKIFVENQKLLYEEMTSTKTVLEAKPLYMAFCPGTYCNYDCIMCVHGRTPQRHLPDFIWEELPSFLPTLHVLTLLGGEPLANKHVENFLQSTKIDDYPDLQIDLITNGSLLTPKYLQKMQNTALGSLTISVNAGSADVYRQIMRGIEFHQLLKNFDAILEYRSKTFRWIDITLSFVVQPQNSHDLINFIKLAYRYHFNIRLIPLSPESVPELDFYGNEVEKQKVLKDLENCQKFVQELKPSWLSEVQAVTNAIKYKKLTHYEFLPSPEIK